MTETRETKLRERFEQLTPGLTHIRDGSRYVDRDTQLAWTLYVEGREDALEEAAQLADSFKGGGLHGYDGKEWWTVVEKIAEALRSLSSKKDSVK